MTVATTTRPSDTVVTYSEAQEMLSLSLLSYRGFADPGISFISRSIVRRSIAGGMQDWPTLRGWELAWGPAIHQAPLTIFDDDVVFVAKHPATHRYAVAIRGTNPVDLLDWVLGDFLVRNLLDWPLDTRGGPGAGVSVSTYRGLMYLLHLQAGGTIDAVWDRMTGAVIDGARSALADSVQRIDPLIDRALAEPEPGGIADTLQTRTIRRRVRRRPHEQRWETFGEAWGHLETLDTSPAPRPASGLDRFWDWAALHAIEVGVFPQRLRPGITLVEYLARELDEGGKAKVIVTGHSKGGALAPVLALWLAQTQGTDVGEEADAWDPGRKATVSCHAFAGPTPGNAAFADLYDDVLGERGHRYANRVDVAPHAWAVNERTDGPGLHLRKVGRLYGHAVAEHPILAPLLDLIIDAVDGLDYAHPGRDVTILRGRTRPGLSLAGQMVHQHLPAYVDLMGLAGVIDAFDAVA